MLAFWQADVECPTCGKLKVYIEADGVPSDDPISFECSKCGQIIIAPKVAARGFWRFDTLPNGGITGSLVGR